MIKIFSFSSFSAALSFGSSGASGTPVRKLEADCGEGAAHPTIHVGQVPHRQVISPKGANSNMNAHSLKVPGEKRRIISNDSDDEGNANHNNSVNLSSNRSSKYNQSSKNNTTYILRKIAATPQSVAHTNTAEKAGSNEISNSIFSPDLDRNKSNHQHHSHSGTNTSNFLLINKSAVNTTAPFNNTNSPDLVNTKLENMLYQKKISEVYQVLRESKSLGRIKGSVISLLFEFLNESSNVNTAFEVMKLLIDQKATTHLNKYIIKTFFGICSKAKQSNLARYITQMFEDSYKTGNFFSCFLGISNGSPNQKAISLSPFTHEENLLNVSLETSGKIFSQTTLFLVNQYFTNTLVRCGEIEEGAKNLKRFLEIVEIDSENSKYIHKMFETVLKGFITASIKSTISCSSSSPHISLYIELLDLLKELKIKPNDIFFNKLIDLASKNNNLIFSEHIYNTLLSCDIQPSIVTYNTLIDCYFKHKKFEKAWEVFEQLKSSKIPPDNFTYTTMINGIKSAECPDLKRAFLLFEEYKLINKPDQIIYNCLLDACINARDYDKAHFLLDEMKKDKENIKLDEITYNTLIKGCCKTKQLIQAVSFYDEMKALGIKPNRITYNSLIDTCVKSNKMNIAWKFYDEMIKADIIPDNFTYSILINGIKSNNTSKEELLKAINILEQIKDDSNFKPDEIFYNSLIDACVKFNEVNKGLSLFEEMKKKNIEPSSITYGILIKAFGKMNDLVKAFKIFEQIKLKNLKINDVTYGCLLDACVKNDRIDLALVLVEKMKADNISLNTILYTTLIKGFSKANKLDEALKIFSLMKESPSTYPNIITYNCILDACVKSQNTDKALEIFSEMKRKLQPDLITYSTLVKGFCKKEDVEIAYNLFSEMISQKILPDEVLVNLIMEACFANQKYDLGVEVFNSMNDLRIRASNITYGILIKIYGQAKKLPQAINVLTTMKENGVRPSLIVYTNLLQACFNLKKVDKAVLIYEKMQQDNIKLDSTCFGKLVQGALKCSRVELAFSFAEKAVQEAIYLHPSIVSKLVEDLTYSTLDNRSMMIAFLEDKKNFKATAASRGEQSSGMSNENASWKSNSFASSSYQNRANNSNSHSGIREKNFNKPINSGSVNKHLLGSNEKEEAHYESVLTQSKKQTNRSGNESSFTEEEDGYKKKFFNRNKNSEGAATKNKENQTENTRLRFNENNENIRKENQQLPVPQKFFNDTLLSKHKHNEAPSSGTSSWGQNNGKKLQTSSSSFNGPKSLMLGPKQL